MSERPEPLVIRPPSEWRSLLLRVTRGCRWNRCKFCGIYPALGERGFSIRPAADLLREIDWYAERMGDVKTVFLGDADPLAAPVETLEEVLLAVRRKMPWIERVTSYGRVSSVKKIGSEGVKRLAGAGLNRLHLGLESGDRSILAFQRKGQTPDLVVRTGLWLKEAAVEVSFYVLLGLGGADRWKDHVDGTADVLSRIDPEWIRLRRLWIYGEEELMDSESPLLDDIRAGRFEPQSAEGTVLELRRLVEGLKECTGRLLCDHANNFVAIDGSPATDREKMLAQIDEFLSLPREEREAHYRRVGSRV